MRTWDRRYGIGPADHAPGRPRRYSPDDVARLEMMRHALIHGATPADAAEHARRARRCRTADVALIGPAPVTSAPDTTDRDLIAHTRQGSPGAEQPDESERADLTHRVRAQAVLGSVDRRCACPAPGGGHAAWARPYWRSTAILVRELLTESIAAVGLQRTWDDVTRPVLSAVAQRWADTGVGIEIEHLLSDCVTGVFGAAVSDAPRAGSPAPARSCSPECPGSTPCCRWWCWPQPFHNEGSPVVHWVPTCLWRR